jgi:hypothetical protein
MIRRACFLLRGFRGGAKGAATQSCFHSPPPLTLMNVGDVNQWTDEEPQSLAYFQVHFLSLLFFSLFLVLFLGYSVPVHPNMYLNRQLSIACVLSHKICHMVTPPVYWFQFSDLAGTAPNKILYITFLLLSDNIRFSYSCYILSVRLRYYGI